LLCVTVCALALIRAPVAQDAPIALEKPREPWSSSAQQELPLPESAALPLPDADSASPPPPGADSAAPSPPDAESTARTPPDVDRNEPTLPSAEDSAEQTADEGSSGPTPSNFDEADTRDAAAKAADIDAIDPATQEAALDPATQTAAQDAVTQTPAFEGATPQTPALDDAPSGVGNDDVLAMTGAQFSETTILAVIAANSTRFDVSPRSLVALKNAGVSETVIEAMLAAETAKKVVPIPAADSEPAPSEEFAKLSAMIERLAAQQETAEVARRPPDPPKGTDSSPRAWILHTADRTALAPTIAQVAFTDEKGGARLKTLQGLAGKALAFANPAVSGIASTLGGLFRSDNEERTAVWALAGTSASRELAAETAFEIEYGHTPGADPDAYQPAIVRLVRTNDNYRLVAAAKTEGTKTIATAKDPIVEELVPMVLTRIGRGHYRVKPKDALATGEYALVLRPIVQKERRRRGSEASLGELLGGTSQILYLTWDFSIAAP
jgi:hypothetical protein